MNETLIEEYHRRLTKKETVEIKLKVVPGSSRTKLMGLLGEDTVKIKVSAPPEKGKANKEVMEFLSELFHIPTKNIQITRGETSPHKTVRITP